MKKQDFLTMVAETEHIERFNPDSFDIEHIEIPRIVNAISTTVGSEMLKELSPDEEITQEDVDACLERMRSIIHVIALSMCDDIAEFPQAEIHRMTEELFDHAFTV